MNIGGALGIGGTAKLGTFSWGSSILAIANTHLAEDKKILLTDSCNEAMEKIITLGDVLQGSVLSIDIGPLEPEVKESKGSRFKFVAVVIGIAMAAMGVMVTSVYSSGTGGDNAPDKEMVEGIFQMLTEIFKLVLSM